ncbi:MAG: magnesium-translocating P-type ATPase, partial [Pseudomonadota bacterium]
PVAKRPAAVPVPTPEWRDAAHAVFMGTSLTAGRARVLVMATGPRTVLGGISRALAREPPATAFETGTRRFGLLIVRLTLLLVLAALLINAVHGRPWLDSFLFAVALAVGLTPELLPMVVSVTLAHGAARMARHRTIVRHLPAIQNLGSLDVLCTDKTGTLTESRIELDRHVDPRGRDSARVLELAWLNAHFSSGLRSPLDDAILRHTEVDANGWRKLAERPFDFERRRVGVVLERAGERRLVVKGAPETLLALCEHYETGDPREPARPLGPAEREALAARRAELAAAGLRTLGVAWRTVGDGAPPAADDERALVFAGYCAFLDPPKAGAAAALEALARDGVAVKILTGDEEAVARHVCRRLGLAIESSLSGAAVAAFDEQALAVRAAATTLFYRVDPAQKERIVRALHRRGHVVGSLGAGLNDAPALHAADVGISVAGAVDVAREAAQFILLDHDLGVLHEAVMQGRRTHANLTKYLLMGTSSSFGNMFSMAAAAAFLPFLPMLPAQILLNNLLYDLSEIAIPFDAVDAEELARPRTWDVDVVRDFMMRIGPVSSAFDLLTFAILLQAFAAPAPLFQTGWVVESLTTQVLVIFVIRTRGSPLASRPHPALAWTALAVVALGWLLPATAVGAWFGLVPLPWQLYATIGLLAVGYLLLVERVKQAFFAGVRRRQRPC